MRDFVVTTFWEETSGPSAILRYPRPTRALTTLITLTTIGYTPLLIISLDSAAPTVYPTLTRGRDRGVVQVTADLRAIKPYVEEGNSIYINARSV